MSVLNNGGRRTMKNAKVSGRLTMAVASGAIGLLSVGCIGDGLAGLGGALVRPLSPGAADVLDGMQAFEDYFKKRQAEQWANACAQGIPMQMLDEMAVEAATKIGTEFPNMLEADKSIQTQVVLAISNIEVTDPSIGNSAQMSYRKIVGLLRKNPRMAGLVQIHEGTYRQARQQIDHQLGYAAPKKNPFDRGPDTSGPVRVDESLVYQLKASFSQANENMEDRKRARRKFLVEVQVLHLDSGLVPVSTYLFKRVFRWDDASKQWVREIGATM